MPIPTAGPGTDDGEFLVDTIPRRLSIPGMQMHSAAAFDGANYLVVWEDWPTVPSRKINIHGARVTSGGALLDPGSIAISTAPDDQARPAIAFDGANYLVVWVDQRGGIYGARVSPAGTVLDPEGIAVDTATSYQDNPALAFDGENFLVVWDGAPRFGYDISGARVTPSGQVLDPEGIAISTGGTGGKGNASVASNGSGSLVVWSDGRNDPGACDIYGARVTQDGVVLDTAGIAIRADAGAGLQFLPKVASDGNDYFVVWQDCSILYWKARGARVTRDGVVLDTAGVYVGPGSWSRDQMTPAVAFGDSNYLVVWIDVWNGNNLFGGRVTPAGAVLDTGFSVTENWGWECSPTIAFDGVNFLVAWNDTNSSQPKADVWGDRISQTGVRINRHDLLFSAITNTQTSPAIAFDGTNYLLVWEDAYQGYPTTVASMRVGPAGDRVDYRSWRIPFYNETTQCMPAVAHGDTEYLAAWEDLRNGNPNVYGCRVNDSGVSMDFEFPLSSITGTQTAPKVAFGDTDYAVVWADGRGGIYGARVTSGGGVRDSQGLAIATSGTDLSAPAIAFDGMNFLVVWQAETGNGLDIRGARVSQTGIVLDTTGVAVCSLPGDQSGPELAFDGANYVVVWQDGRNGPNAIYAARVSTSGVVLDPDGIPIAASPDAQSAPALATSGAGTTILWTEVRNGFSNVLGANLSQSGAVTDTFPVVTQPSGAETPAIAKGNGQEMLMAYSGWAGFVQGKAYSAMRIWGQVGPFPGIEEHEARSLPALANTVRIGPNPAGAFVLVYSAAPITRLRLYDVAGALLGERRWSSTQSGKVERADLDGIAPGVYLLRVTTALGECVRKFVKSR
jgi:hypothetical protein